MWNLSLLRFLSFFLKLINLFIYLFICLLYLECPELPSFIPNGQVYGSGSIQGSLFRFSCLAGYSLIGQSNTLLCNADGKWNASVPRCLKGNFTNSCHNRSPFSDSAAHLVSSTAFLVLIPDAKGTLKVSYFSLVQFITGNCLRDQKHIFQLSA